MADRITSHEARRILKVAGDGDFHALDSNAVDYLLGRADAYGYRQPKNANGSRARYWHAYLTRLAARKD